MLGTGVHMGNVGSNETASGKPGAVQSYRDVLRLLLARLAPRTRLPVAAAVGGTAAIPAPMSASPPGPAV